MPLLKGSHDAVYPYVVADKFNSLDWLEMGFPDDCPAPLE